MTIMLMLDHIHMASAGDLYLSFTTLSGRSCRSTSVPNTGKPGTTAAQEQ
jgi:hypothetical protein